MTIFRVMYDKSYLYTTIYSSFITVPPAKVEGCDSLPFTPRKKGEKKGNEACCVASRGGEVESPSPLALPGEAWGSWGPGR